MREITYYYSAHSAFAYLGHRDLLALCAARNVRLIHRPIALSPVVEAQGSLPFADRTQAHVDYFFGREIERWAEWRGLDVLRHRPTHHDADYATASRMILALGDHGPDVDAFCGEVLRAHWCDDADLSDETALMAMAARVGLDGADLLHRAHDPRHQAQYDANTGAARAMGVMGSPTYVLEGEMFYGQDRLDMLARALETPFAPTRWRNPPVG